jgi:hypothetical protein
MQLKYMIDFISSVLSMIERASFLGVILLLLNCRGDVRNEQVISFFKESYSYEWNQVRLEKVEGSLIDKCQRYYDDEIQEGDKLILKRAFMEQFKGEQYLIVEFDFKDALDARICFVLSREELILGYFERFLA